MFRSPLVLFVLVGLFAGCAHQQVEKTADGPPIRITNHDDIQTAIRNNTTVKVVGTAQNAKLGGIVESPILVVYCIDQHWPDAVEGQMVEVTGKLSIATDTAAKQDESGAWSQGTAPGTSLTVIEPCRYHLLSTD